VVADVRAVNSRPTGVRRAPRKHPQLRVALRVRAAAHHPVEAGNGSSPCRLFSIVISETLAAGYTCGRPGRKELQRMVTFRDYWRCKHPGTPTGVHEHRVLSGCGTRRSRNEEDCVFRAGWGSWLLRGDSECVARRRAASSRRTPKCAARGLDVRNAGRKTAP